MTRISLKWCQWLPQGRGCHTIALVTHVITGHGAFVALLSLLVWKVDAISRPKPYGGLIVTYMHKLLRTPDQTKATYTHQMSSYPWFSGISPLKDSADFLLKLIYDHDVVGDDRGLYPTIVGPFHLDVYYVPPGRDANRNGRRPQPDFSGGS